MLTERTRISTGSLLIFLAILGTSGLPARASLRRIHLGDKMPEFSLQDANGVAFSYTHERGRPLAVVILQTRQERIERMVADIETVVEKLRAKGLVFDCVGVLSGPGDTAYVQSRQPEAKARLPLLLDPEFRLWGKLGVVAAPTAVVSGPDHEVKWVKAGYGFDFIPNLQAQLAKAAGLRGASDEPVRVETLQNSSSRARQKRHLLMARALAKKGKLEAAIKEMRALHELDPNSVDVALELGEYLCRAGRNEAALEVVASTKASSSRDKARTLLVSGWAKRQMGQLDEAESLLTQAVELDAGSARILYELGKIHQARGAFEKAVACYRRALALVFDETEPVGPSQK